MDKDRIVAILNSELRYMFLVSLISADSNITEEEIRENLERLEICKAVTEEISYAEKINNLDEVKDYINQGIVILNRDLEELKK